MRGAATQVGSICHRGAGGMTSTQAQDHVPNQELYDNCTTMLGLLVQSISSGRAWYVQSQRASYVWLTGSAVNYQSADRFEELSKVLSSGVVIE